METLPFQYVTPAPTTANTPPVWKFERVIAGRRLVEWYAEGVVQRDYPAICTQLRVAAANLDDPYPFATRRAAEAGYIRKHGAPFPLPCPVFFYTRIAQLGHRRSIRRMAEAVGFKPGILVELALPGQKRTRWVPLAQVEVQSLEVCS